MVQAILTFGIFHIQALLISAILGKSLHIVKIMLMELTEQAGTRKTKLCWLMRWFVNNFEELNHSGAKQMLS